MAHVDKNSRAHKRDIEARYRASPKGRATTARYKASVDGKAVQARADAKCRATDKGRATNARADAKYAASAKGAAAIAQRAAEYNASGKRKAVDARRAKNNPEKRIARDAHKRATKLQATPLWSDLGAIQDKYEFAKLWSGIVGREYEVDHVVPLKSKHVCGLHTEHNLQVITKVANRAKSNCVWPDML